MENDGCKLFEFSSSAFCSEDNVLNSGSENIIHVYTSKLANCSLASGTSQGAIPKGTLPFPRTKEPEILTVPDEADKTIGFFDLLTSIMNDTVKDNMV